MLNFAVPVVWRCTLLGKRCWQLEPQPCYCWTLGHCWTLERERWIEKLLTLPRRESKSAVPVKVEDAVVLWDRVVTSRSASGVVTVLARPSTAAFKAYSLRMMSSWRASRALMAGSTSPFCKWNRLMNKLALKWFRMQQYTQPTMHYDSQ